MDVRYFSKLSSYLSQKTISQQHGGALIADSIILSLAATAFLPRFLLFSVLMFFFWLRLHRIQRAFTGILYVVPARWMRVKNFWQPK